MAKGRDEKIRTDKKEDKGEMGLDKGGKELEVMKMKGRLRSRR